MKRLVGLLLLLLTSTIVFAEQVIIKKADFEGAIPDRNKMVFII